MQSSRRATIKDVAKAAGVSPTTVSHALNGKGVVRQGTIEKIREIADDLGYEPNAMARGLRNRKMGLIALAIRPFVALDSFVLPGVDYFLRIAGSAALTAMEHGYSLMLVNDPSKDDSPLSSQAADAYIVVEPYANDPVLTHLLRTRVPIVVIGSDLARPDTFTTMDLLAPYSAEIGLAHLVQSGATRIALVVGTDNNAWNLESREAYVTWCHTARQEPIVVEVPEALGESAGDEVVDSLFGPDRINPPDGIYCLMGRQASGIAKIAIERGIRVPEDLLILAGSVANQNFNTQPSISALDPMPEVLAQLAVDAAVRLVEGKEVVSPFPGPTPVLHVRQSTTRLPDSTQSYSLSGDSNTSMSSENNLK